MNNIEVDSIILNNENIFLEGQDVSYIKVSGNSEVNLFNCNIINLDIEVLDNSSLIVNCFNIIEERKTAINIIAHQKSKVTFNHGFKNNCKYDLKIMTDFLKDEASICVNINGLNDGGIANIDVNGFVKYEKNNNVLDENIRIININGGSATSNPNMYIDTSKVIANHNTTIGGIRLDELFYLMGKGLTKESSKKIISKGHILKVIKNDDMLVKIREILN